MLPASRFDILSVVISGIFGALLSETPQEGKTVSVLLTAVSNAWAIASSVLTAKDLLDDPDVYSNLWYFMMGILVLTVITSSCALVSLIPGCSDCDCCFGMLFLIGFFAIIGTLSFCLVQLNLTHSNGCAGVDPSLMLAWCERPSSDVHTALWVTAAVAVVGSLIIGIVSLNGEDPRCALLGIGDCLSCMYWGIVSSCPCTKDIEKGFDPMDDDDTRTIDKHSCIAATVNRVSAFVKICLFSVYWYFVDQDMSWGDLIDDMTWWVSGQWAKNLAGFANNFLNRC
ncbi:hypothetical protein PHYBOEH_000238 [Phytophthora boehmeriae]|uniref:Transmembrane protein n=1 Tax=Phytophthora boehmeriae TaxID=109152 RepID=A0A8T1WY42_9STRA|nr:hypothetical protein PHYBOEH_000238 [Phytophthora boehmeriae]